MGMKQKKLIVVGVVLSVLSGTLWYVRSTGEAKRTLALKLQKEQGAGQTVEVEKSISAPLTRRITAVGTLKANDQVVIKPAEAAHIAELLFKEGEKINKGDPLVVFENSVQKAEYESAKTTMNVQKSNYLRAEELLKRGASTPAQRDKALLEFKQAEAHVNSARAKLDKTIIRAPFSGYVSFRDSAVSVGAWMQPGQEMMHLLNIDLMKTEFQIPEAYINDVRIGQEVEVFVETEAKSSKAAIEAIDAKINPLTHSVMVRAVIHNPAPYFKVGQFANIKMEVGRSGNVIQINESAIETHGDQSFIYRVMDDKAIRTRVMTGNRDKGRVEIIDGVSEGDLVVIAGQVKLRDGDKVRIVNKEALPEEGKNSLDGVTKPLEKMMLGPKSVLFQPTLMKLAKKKKKEISASEPSASLEKEGSPSIQEKEKKEESSISLDSKEANLIQEGLQGQDKKRNVESKEAKKGEGQ